MIKTTGFAKLSLCFGLILLLLTIISGCQKKDTVVMSNREILAKLGVDTAGEELVAVIINEPTAEELAAFSRVSEVTRDENAEKLLIVPLSEGAVIRVEQIIWSNSQNGFVSGQVVHTSEPAIAGDALHMEVIRPEGMPHLRVLVHETDRTAEYLVSYNGKDGTPELERLEATTAADLTWEGQVAPAVGDGTNEPEDQPQGEMLKEAEISQIFTMTEADIIGLYGPPTERRSEEFFEGMSFPHLYYGATEFALDNEEGGLVFQAIIYDNLLPAPRGVLIGDTVDSLLAKFLNEKPTEFIQDAAEPTKKEQLLYGSGSYMTDYGKVIYQNDQPIEVLYATQEGVALQFFIENNLVHRVMYSLPMT